VKYCEHHYPDLLPNLSTCKSPHQMMGAVLKSYYAGQRKIDPAKMRVVSVMPCTAKKFEIGRDGQSAAGVRDVDISITTRELARLIKRLGINFDSLPDGGFDSPLGSSTGAAAIFGVTGGVMEAALRTAARFITGAEAERLNFTEVRGFAGVKEASYKVGGLDVKVAVVSGTANAAELLKKVRGGEADYAFIEVMGCPGGCVNGGGQPRVAPSVRNRTDVRQLRANALYALDEADAIRVSHENPDIKKLYGEYLQKPGSHRAHETLHTSYVKRGLY